ncbi:MAG: cyclase family protein [Propionibacteriaceae bacterium]|nr:cyclase family protein [Propionibacteriaceae bacterium]
MTEYRAHFDADVEFVNGGRLTAEGFRLDLPGPALSEEEIGELFIRHLGLALVGRVELRAVEIVAEPHKGSRGVRSERAESPAGRLVDLSHTISAGLVTYPGLPVPTIRPHLTREASRSHYAEGTEFALDVITLAGNSGTYLDSPYHRYADGADLAELELETLVDLPLEPPGWWMQQSGTFQRRCSTTATCEAPPCWCIPAGIDTSALLLTPPAHLSSALTPRPI